MTCWRVCITFPGQTRVIWQPAALDVHFWIYMGIRNTVVRFSFVFYLTKSIFCGVDGTRTALTDLLAAISRCTRYPKETRFPKNVKVAITELLESRWGKEGITSMIDDSYDCLLLCVKSAREIGKTVSSLTALFYDVVSLHV